MTPTRGQPWYSRLVSTNHQPQERSATADLLSTLLDGDTVTVRRRALRVRVVCRRDERAAGEYVVGQVVEERPDREDANDVVYQATPLLVLDEVGDVEQAVDAQREVAARRVVLFAVEGRMLDVHVGRSDVVKLRELLHSLARGRAVPTGGGEAFDDQLQRWRQRLAGELLVDLSLVEVD